MGCIMAVKTGMSSPGCAKNGKEDKGAAILRLVLIGSRCQKSGSQAHHVHSDKCGRIVPVHSDRPVQPHDRGLSAIGDYY